MSSNQAADKHYVDTSVAGVGGGTAGKVALAPSGTQIVTQPAGTDLEVNRLNGAQYASQYATVPNSNGIAGATTASDCAGAGAAGLGCVVTVEPTVTGQENYILKTGWGGQTHVQDMRLGAQHDTYFNPKTFLGAGNEVGQGIDVTTTDSPGAVAQATTTGAIQSTALDVKHTALAGGSNLFAAELGTVPYFKTTYEGSEVIGVYNTQGQHVLSTFETSCYAVGDCLIGSHFVHSMGGLRDNADEGTHLFDTEVREDPRVFTGTCATGCTSGSQSVTVGSQTNGGTQGDGRYLIDKNPASVISSGSLTGGSAGTIHPVATFTGTSFPVSTFFLSGALIPSQAHNVAPGTVTIPIATTGVPTGFSTNTAAAPSSSGVACIAGQSTILTNWEMVPYTVVDATHLQMTLLKPHGASSTIAIGGLCGYGLEQKVDTINGIRQVFPVVGSYAVNGLYYAGSATAIVGQMGQTSAYKNLSFPIVSAVRASNVVTLTVPSTSGYDVTGLTMTVAGATDSSYNGTFTMSSTSSTTLTYPETGANSTTTGGTLSLLTGGYALYPMAEVLSVYNPATKSADGLFTLAPNTVAWAANDPVEEPHYFQVKIGADTAIVSQFSPRPLIQQNTGYIYQDNVGPTMRGFTIQNLAPTSNYFGSGGTHGYPDTAYVSQGVWNRDFDAQAGEQSVFSVHCNSKGCSRWNSAYNLFELDSSAGVDTMNYAPQTSTLALSLRGTAYSFSPLAFTAGTANITTLNVSTLNTGAMSSTSVASSGALSGASLTTGAITGTSETLTGTATSAAVNTGVVTATTLNGALAAANVTSGTLAAARLPVMTGSGASHAVGAVPDPGATAGTARYLREDGTWVAAAPLASPTLTGTPTAPTAAVSDNSTTLATTAFVNKALTSLVAGFPAVTNHAFLLTEGTGTTITDAIGGATAATTGTASWNTDGSLNFADVLANRFTTNITGGFQGMEVVFASTLPTAGNAYQMPLCYGGLSASSSTADEECLSLSTTFYQTPSTALTLLPSYAGFYDVYNASPNMNYASATAAPGQTLHVLSLSSPPGSPRTLYLDGQPVSNWSAAAFNALAAGFNGGVLEIGGSPLGYASCSATTCGFTGKIYGVSTYSTAPNPAQVQQSYHNWLKVVTNKGGNTAQTALYYAGNGAQSTAGKAVNIVAHGESLSWGHGLTTPLTQAYPAIAANTVNGGNAFGVGAGTDSATVYTMVNAVGGMQHMFSPVATNVAILFPNANDCKANGTIAGSPTYAANRAMNAAQGMMQMTATLQAQGWLVIWGTGTSGAYGTGDTGKDQCNPALRQRAIAAGIPLWDIASDPRVGADGASAAGATACSSGAVYQSDTIHWTSCYHAFAGANLATLINSLLFSAPVTTTATSYVMTGMEMPLKANPAGGSQVITLPDCIGLSPGNVFSVVNMQASGANTVTVNPLTSTLSTETINGQGNYLLGNGLTANFRPYNSGDASAGCTWTASR